MGAIDRPLVWQDYPRPTGEYYERRLPYLSQGDIFLDCPYALLGPEILVEDFGGVPAALVPLASVPAMLLTPTCDFRRPSAADLAQDPTAQPYTLEKRLRVARIVPLDFIERDMDSLKRSQKLDTMRRYDNLRRFMYLPPLEGVIGESAVELGPTWLVHLDVLLGLERPVQLTLEAARQLHYKLVYYETGNVIERPKLHPPMD